MYPSAPLSHDACSFPLSQIYRRSYLWNEIDHQYREYSCYKFMFLELNRIQGSSFGRGGINSRREKRAKGKEKKNANDCIILAHFP